MPVAGLAREIELADRDRLPPDEIALLLASLRAGDQTARQALIDGLRFLVYERSPAQMGNRYIALVDAVGRLARNDVQDVVGYVRDAMRRETRRAAQAETPNLYPPPSTNSTRRKRGKPLYEPLRRVEGDVEGIEETDIDLLIDLCQTELERDVVALLEHGHTYLVIAAALGVTKHRVAAVVEVLRDRAMRLGYDVPRLHGPSRDRPNVPNRDQLFPAGITTTRHREKPVLVR